ncbi:hypothetical protein [Duganella callida]|uniref:2OG-Fe(II) oxygenase n=1 Tax=Duganella callida TaxID=2561932 RepID=A0A4Y9SH17_9BURK|nr:hypothetical protein [Duganella callida]TFW20679.1 hypothetical protein E4L98_14415 [Duganella callida]
MNTAALRAPAPATRTDSDIGGQLAFMIDNVISDEASRAMIAVGEHFGYRNDAPGMRMNQAMHWMADEAPMAQIFKVIGPLLPQELHGKKLQPRLSQRIDMYKYRKGDVFNRHIDGIWPGYGGPTVDVTSRAGAALFFQHGFSLDSVMHMGTEVTSDAPKYVARIDVLYDPIRGQFCQSHTSSTVACATVELVCDWQN